MKKSFSLIGALLGVGLLLMGAGCTNKLEGVWVSEKPIDGSIVELEFTKSRLIGTGERVDTADTNKKSSFKVSMDYVVTQQLQNVSQVAISNPEVNVAGNLADEKTQVQWQEQGKAYLNRFNSFSFSVSEDGKTMTLNTTRTGEIGFRRK
jgi:hypothetical protein